MTKQEHILTVTAPAGAVCGLHPQAPASLSDFNAIDPKNALPATRVTTENGITTYCYAGLEPGLYHCAATMEGHYGVCQMVNLPWDTQIDLRLDKLAGGGYESGFLMLSTPDFCDACLVSGKDAWGPEYEPLFRTPQFLRKAGTPGRHRQTTNEEMADFIPKLSEAHPHMHVFSLGSSPKYGYDMPLVLFTRENVSGMTLAQAAQAVRKNGKPTVQYTAQCHGNEPSSCEGALAMMLALCGDLGSQVLEAVDVYIIPRINPDGAFEVARKSPTTGEDMNRDYLYMHNAEVRMVTAAYNLFLPEIAIDGHEKRTGALLTGDNLCTDMEVQTGAGSLNHPAVMTELAMKMALAALAKGRELGLRTHFYTKFASAAGGSAGSSYFGTRNSLSFLVETPGQSPMGMLWMERRVLAHYTLASTVIRYAAEHHREVMETVRASREHMIRTGAVYDETDVIVLEHGKTETGTWASPLINVPTGKVTDPNHTVAYEEHTLALQTRPRATAYILPRELEQESEILRVAGNHDLPHFLLPAGSVVKLRQYLQDADGICLGQECRVCFEKGAYVFPNTVPSTVLGVIMEPDFNRSSGRKMTLLSMGLIHADESGRLPLYRYCHDLINGTVATEK